MVAGANAQTPPLYVIGSQPTPPPSKLLTLKYKLNLHHCSWLVLPPKTESVPYEDTNHRTQRSAGTGGQKAVDEGSVRQVGGKGGH